MKERKQKKILSDYTRTTTNNNKKDEFEKKIDNIRKNIKWEKILKRVFLLLWKLRD